MNAFTQIPQEPRHYNDDFKGKHIELTNNNWPNKGEIEFTNLKLKYRDDLPFILKGLNCVINPGSRVGIVGRTGAGKSSIMVCLFRLFEPEGSIKIDNIETTKEMGLFDLRSNLAIIPQDPILFSGTLRFNLDPFNKYNDNDIINALKKVYLWNEYFSTKNAKLNYIISENGSNLSSGQKQLICIARVLLKKPKLLLLDEATASIDYQSDLLIQKSIKNSFDKNTTILTIAHRLQTIIDSDKIMVLGMNILYKILIKY